VHTTRLICVNEPQIPICIGKIYVYVFAACKKLSDEVLAWLSVWCGVMCKLYALAADLSSTELSAHYELSQLLLLQADTSHHALQPAAVCRPLQQHDSWHMHPC